MSTTIGGVTTTPENKTSNALRLGARARRLWKDLIFQATSLLLLLLAWQCLVYLPFLSQLPGPASVAKAALDVNLMPFLNDALRSMYRVAAGFGIAAAIGIPLGIAIGHWRLVHHVLFPIVEILRPIPPIAWIPLSVLFFVAIESQIIFLTCYGAFFPIVYNTIAGVSAIDLRLIRAARSLGASEWDIFRRIVLPGTMPQIFTGLSIAVGITWLMVVAAEMIAARGGLGYVTWEAYTTLNYPMIFVGMASIGVLGALTSTFLRWLDRRIMPWRKRI